MPEDAKAIDVGHEIANLLLWRHDLGGLVALRRMRCLKC